MQADGAYHLIKLERRIEPKAVKFDDVRQSLARKLHDRKLQAAITELLDRMTLAELAGADVPAVLTVT